ncbi:MAG: site-specific integrase [Oscillospiraceae bacterium]|nr:site-specific integrase [Oscillospiraceae bacterium]
MARPKKPTYEWVPSRNQYRKRIKDSDGKYVALYAKDPDELTMKIKLAEREIEEAVFRRENPTVKDYAEKWLVMRSAHVRKTTLADYTSKVKNYIIEPLGDKYMADVTPDDVNMAITKAAERSASIYRSVQMLYKSIFYSAYKSDIIDHSPCEDLDPKGGKSAKEKKALTEKQVQTLLDAIRGLPPYTFVLVCLYSGLRREEALALQWDCVFLDDAAPHIYVDRAWHIENNRPVVTHDLKTKASRRTIPIPPQLVRHLKAVKEASISDYVIANRDGEPLSGTQWQRLWKYITTRTAEERVYYRYKDGVKTKHVVQPVLGEAAAHNSKVVYSIDFHVTPHQLRHTYITNLLLAGVDVKTVQALAGHENAKITLDIYAHLTYNRPKDLISKVNMAFQDTPV